MLHIVKVFIEINEIKLQKELKQAVNGLILQKNKS